MSPIAVGPPMTDRGCMAQRKSVGGPNAHGACCTSSVVEHSLGKGEVDSSILSCSTSPTPDNCRMFGTDTGAHLRCSASPGLDRQRTSPNCRHATDTLGREVVTGRPARSAPPQSKPTTARKREETSRRRMLTDRCMTAGGEVRFRMGCWTLMIFGGPAKKSDPGDQTTSRSRMPSPSGRHPALTCPAPQLPPDSSADTSCPFTNTLFAA